MYEMQVDHIDGNHMNNNITNLRWVTSQENNVSARESGYTPARSRAITDENIISIMELAAEGYSDETICNLLPDIKIAPETVRFIRTGQSIYGDVLLKLGINPIFKRERSYISDNDREDVCKLYNEGFNSIEISNKTGISDRSVRRIIQNANLREPAPKAPISPVICIPDQYQDLDIHLVNVHTSNLHEISPVYGVTRDGRMFSMARGNKWTEMTIGTNPRGHQVIGLNTNHGSKQYFVHRLVLATFSPVPNMYDLEIRHINGNNADCRLENLEWTTHSENMLHVAANTDRAPCAGQE